MTWNSDRKIIRRFLRDPNAKIWEDAYLLNEWNDEQMRFNQAFSILENVENVRVPPNYQMSYMHDWEWQHRDQDGKNYQCFSYHQQSDLVYVHRWEGQQLGYTSASDSDQGDHFTHPWEAWYVTADIGDLVPFWLPDNFEKMMACYWDREPIDYIEYKSLQGCDTTYRTRTGKPVHLYRLDETSNEAYMHPIPSSPVWDDFDDEPVLMGVSGDSYSQNYGTLTDATGTVLNETEGATYDVVSEDDNLLIVYKERPKDIEDDADIGDYPEWMHKYIRYAVLESAYKANTDGKINSLAGYWEWRKQIGQDAVKSYINLRKTDRDYRLVSQPAIKRGRTRRARTGSFEDVFGTSEISTS